MPSSSGRIITNNGVFDVLLSTQALCMLLKQLWNGILETNSLSCGWSPYSSHPDSDTTRSPCAQCFPKPSEVIQSTLQDFPSDQHWQTTVGKPSLPQVYKWGLFRKTNPIHCIVYCDALATQKSGVVVTKTTQPVKSSSI